MLDMASKRRLQLIRENEKGVYNPGGARTQMISITGMLQPDSAFSKFRPQGYNVDAWNAMVRTHQVYSGTIRFDFAQMPVIMRMLCGDPITDTTAGGVRTEVFTLPDSGERALVTFTVEDGSLTDCRRCPFGVLLSLSLSTERMGDEVTGNITILCQKPIAEGVAMTGAVNANEIKTIVAAGVSGNGIFNLPATSLGAGGPLTVVPGDTNLQLQTKIRAIAGYNDVGVTVTGSTTVAAAAVDEVQTIQLVSVPSGPVNVNLAGQNASFLAQGTAADVKAAIEALDPTFVGKVTVNNSLVSSSGGIFSGTYQVIFDSSLGNVGQLGSTTAGVTTGTTTEGAIGGGLGSYAITFGGALANQNIPDWTKTSGAGWSTGVTTEGSNATFTLPARVPMLPQNFSIRRAATLAGLAAATPLRGHRTLAMDFGSLINLIWFFNENVLTFGDVVDSENPTQSASVELATKLDGALNPDCVELFANSEKQPSTPEWFQQRAVHPDGVYAFYADLHASVSAAAERRSNNNVYARLFPLGLVLSDAGFSARFTVKTPA